MKKLILMIALGAITGAALAQETDTEATKVALTTDAGVALSNEQLEAYEGSYELMPNFNLEFSIKNGKLISQATGQEKHELVAKGDHKFIPRTFAATITFIPNSQGEFDSLILEQGGQKITAPKVK